MPEELEIEKTKVSLKTAVLILGMLLPATGVYFTMQNKISGLENKINELIELDKIHDRKLIEYKIAEIMNGQVTTNKKLDELTRLISGL